MDYRLLIMALFILTYSCISKSPEKKEKLHESREISKSNDTKIKNNTKKTRNNIIEPLIITNSNCNFNKTFQISIQNVDSTLGKRISSTLVDFLKDTKNTKSYFNPFSQDLTKISDLKRKIIEKITEKVTFERISESYKKLQTTRVSLLDSIRKKFWNVKIDKTLFDNLIINIKDGPFELEKYDNKNNTDNSYIVCDFANKRVGGGICEYDMTQEEQLIIMGAATPAVSEIDGSGGRPNSDKNTFLAKNEALLFQNFPIFGIIDSSLIYPRKGRSWRTILQTLLKDSIKPFKEPILIDILAIDAPPIRTPKDWESINTLNHILDKLLVSMLMLKNKYTTKEEITFVFGNWGLGAFNNSPIDIYSIFILVTAVINKYYPGPNIKVHLHPFEHRETFKNIYRTLKETLKYGTDISSINDLWNKYKSKF